MPAKPKARTTTVAKPAARAATGVPRAAQMNGRVAAREKLSRQQVTRAAVQRTAAGATRSTGAGVGTPVRIGAKPKVGFQNPFDVVAEALAPARKK